ARLFGVGIKVFSLGMGPKLVSWKGKKNRFSIRLLPIGGYVSMVGEYNGQEEELDEEDKGKAPFNKKPVWQRMLVVLAGPFMNIVLGFVVMAVIVITSSSLPSSVVSKFSLNEEFIAPESICFVYVTEGGDDENGLMTNDVIIKVDDVAVPVKSGSTDKFYEMYSSEPHDLTVLRDNRLVGLKNIALPEQSRTGIGGTLQKDDELLSVDGVDVTAENFESVFGASRTEPIDIKVKRDGGTVELKNVIFSKTVENGEKKNYGYFSFYSTDSLKISGFNTTVSSMNLIYIKDENADDEAHLMDGDVILKVDGNPAVIGLGDYFMQFYQKYAGTPHNYRVLRKNDIIDINDETIPVQKYGQNYHLYLFLSGALKVGDEILNIGGTLDDEGDIHGGATVRVSTDMAYRISRDGIYPLDLIVKRDGEILELNDVVFPRYIDSGTGTYFGDVDFYVEPAEKTFGTVMYNAFYQPLSTLKVTVLSIIDTFSGRYGIKAISGPIGVGSMVGEMAKSSTPVSSLSTLLVLISLSVGIANLLPLPVLDGGRFLLLIIEAIRRKPLNPKIESAIMAASMVLVLALMVIVAFKDVWTLWS
ncbi:MAG: site-2 protease family protein, partial [Clostridia bacterium]|nr:site-2 protease family protein [Clostridia bacterium]